MKIFISLFFENMTIISCFFLTISLFCKRLRMFFSKDAICCEDVNKVFLRFVSKCEMWSRNTISDFSFAEISLWIRSRDHAWSSHRLCLTVWLEFFRDDECFDENDSSNMTKATYQIWYKRHFIISDKQHFIKFDEMYLVKSHQIWYQVW